MNGDSSLDVRHDLVQTAVKFLQNPQVTVSPWSQALDFLRRKGLTDAEIQQASQIAQRRLGTQLPQTTPLLPQTNWHKIKQHLHSLVLFGGVVYAVYVFYQRFLKKWLFGDNASKPKSPIDELTEVVHDLKTEMITLRTTQSDISDLRLEISSLKGMLLSRKQFPAAAAPPTIPSWQLEKQEEEGSGSNSNDKNSDSSLEIM